MKISEIAKKAGVSIGTVDRVLHNRGRVSQENIDTVMRIVKESGYEPNQYARSLRQNREFTIGILIPQVGSEFGYWKLVEDGITRAQAQLRTMQVRFVYACYDRSNPQTIAACCNELSANAVDAVIMAPLLGHEIATHMQGLHVPYVFIDSSYPDLHPVADFSQDPVKAGRVGARLMSLFRPNARLLLTVQPYQGAFNGHMRAQGFAQWMAEHSPDTEIRHVTFDSHRQLEEHLSSFLDAGSFEPDGIFVVNDSAHSVSDIITQRNADHHIALIGFDLVDQNRNALADGHIDAILSQRPADQAYDAAMLLYRYLVVGQKDVEGTPAPIDIYVAENL